MPSSRSSISQRLSLAHKRGWMTLLVVLTASTALVKENAVNLQLNLLGVDRVQHAPFDGTVYPIQQVPNWLTATADEREMTFNEFPTSKLVSIPTYQADRLSVDTASLKWGDDYDDHTRQMKITYPVPFAGNYKFDGRENVGSHPAVDVKALAGTPLYAIMNGVVEKVSYTEGGFGHHVVIRHDGVPVPQASGTTTLHSGYAHMNDIFVTDGEVVRKGQMIGTVGRTGTATTNHLHFQVDLDEAPWHMYWPFDSKEAAAAGGFFEALNKGVNKENVYKYTTHPLTYVQAHLDTTAVIATVPEAHPETTLIAPLPEPTPAVTPEVTVTLPEPKPTPLTFTGIETSSPDSLFMKERSSMTVTLVDGVGEPVVGLSLNSPVTIEFSDPLIVQASPMELSGAVLSDGQEAVELIPLKPGQTSFTIRFLGQPYATGTLSVPLDRAPLHSFNLETDHRFFVGQPEEVVVVALTEQGERLSEFSLTSPIQLSVLQGQGDFSKSVLSKEDFSKGMATIQFTPTQAEDVVLGVSVEGYEGGSTLLSTSLFSDLIEGDAYYQAVSYLKRQGVVEGYSDQTFRPNRAVSRVEALKLIFAGLNLEVVEGVALEFKDTDSSAWYADYVSTAQREGIVRGYPDGTFRPATEVNRAEFIKMLLLASGADVDPVVIGRPYDDVHTLDWHAPYAAFVRDKNIGPWSGNALDASAAMTRGEVAEMIYRLVAIQKANVPKYSRTLVLE